MGYTDFEKSTAQELARLGHAVLDLGTNGSASVDYPSYAESLARALREWGRVFFALTLVVFGVQHFLYAGFIATLVTAWIPGHIFWAYFVGVAFIAAALSISTKVYGRLAATLLGMMFLLWVIVLHAPRVFHSVRNGNEWTSAAIALAMSGAAFSVAGALPRRRSS